VLERKYTVEENDNNQGAHVGQKFWRGAVVEVSNDIIETALPANSGHCMISDAVKLTAKRKGWKIGKVLTDLQTIRFTDLKRKIRYVCFTPRVGQLALLAFDQGKKPEPFSFRLKPVQVIAPSEKQVKKTAEKAGKGPSKPRAAIRKGSTRPIKHGGMALATSVGLRREFGMRQLGVYQPPTETATAAEVPA
jgi:hypothetical protein